MTNRTGLHQAVEELFALGATQRQVSRLGDPDDNEAFRIYRELERSGKVRAPGGMRYNLAIKRRASFETQRPQKVHDDSFEAYMLIGLSTILEEFRILDQLAQIARANDYLGQPILPRRYEGLRHLYQALTEGPHADLYPTYSAQTSGMWREFLSLLGTGEYTFTGSFEQLRDQLYCHYLKYNDRRYAQPPNWKGNIVNAFVRLLGTLVEHHRRVIQLRYGLDGSWPRTLDAVALEMNLPRSECERLHDKALRIMREERDWCDKLLPKLAKMFQAAS